MSHENVVKGRKNVVKGRKNVVNCENVVSRPMRTLGMHEECVSENVKPEMCANPVLRTSPCHFKSTEGGPHSIRGGGKTSEPTSTTFSKRGTFTRERTAPSSVKVSTFSTLENKNPYRGGGSSLSTPTKRKLIFNKNTQHLICMFEVKTGSDLPGDSDSSKSPAKRRCPGITGVDDQPGIN